MNKKFLSLVLALVMVLGTFSSVFAAKPAEKKEAKEAPKATEKVVPKVTGKSAKIQWLQDNGYVLGRKVNEDPKNNDLALDKNVQRAEVSKLLVYAIGLDKKADSLKGAYKFYNDVDLTHWANGYINVGSTEPSKANGIAFLLGYPGKVFKPANDVTYAELAKMLVTLTKTDLTKDMHDKANANWPVQWMAWAHDLGIFEDVDVKDSNKAVNREDAFTMIYNAMYKLKYIKKMPNNETRGIISQIKNGEITVNQGEKAKTIKLTPNTTFVLYDRRSNSDQHDVNANPHHSRYDQVVFAGVLSNPSYYYGSFVRVLTNEKGEATHVLELGNPAQLAIGVGAEPWDGANTRWADVADRTAETRHAYQQLSAQGRVINSYKQILAKVNYKDSDAKSISFFEINSPAARDIEKLNVKLTAETKYYVADVVRNQLTEVNSVDEALRIVGNTTAANYIDQVYVGYNTIDGRDARETSKHTAIAGYNEATVVVFNSVQKDNNNARLLRVKNEATRLYDATFEDVKGTEIMGNLISYRGAFPFNFKDAKFNVVRLTENNATGTGIELVIEHSKTDKYPIVKVTDILNSGRSIIVQDVNKHSAVLNLDSEADIFTRDLKVGDVIQFHTLADNVLVNDVDRNNVVDVVSILPAMDLKGALQFIVEDNQANQFYANKVKASDIKNPAVANYNEIDVNQYRYLYNEKSGIERTTIWLNSQDATALTTWINNNGGITDIRYKLRDADKFNRIVAYDVEVLHDNVWYLVGDANNMQALEAANAQKQGAAALEVKVDQLTAKIAKATTQAELNKIATDLNQAKADFTALPFDKVSAADKATLENNFKTKFNAAVTAITTADGTVDTGATLTPPVTAM